MQTIQQNIFRESGSHQFNFDVKPHNPKSEPDSLFILLIQRIAKRYGLTHEQLQRQSDGYTCLPKHCLCYFLFIDIGMSTKKIAELIYGNGKCHANISWLTGRKMNLWLKTKCEYQFCYDDIKIVWNEIIEKNKN